MSFYTWLRSHCPLTHRGFQNRMDVAEEKLEKYADNLFRLQNENLKKIIKQQQNMESDLVRQLQDKNKALLQQFQMEHDSLEKFSSLVQKQNKTILAQIDETKRISIESRRAANEAVWGEIFNQAIQGSSWLKDTSFSPGRWAIGYQYLYALYRILNEVRPKHVLELGLGQSTKMIAQYAAAFPEVSHQVVEHDPEWIAFFARNYTLPQNTKIVRLDREMIPYKEADKVRVFKGFQEQFQKQKFDFISIDAPLGGDMPQYARIDILQMLPKILAPDFVLMFDDCNRTGEQHTVREMEDKLKENGIAYAKGWYSGNKDCVVLAAEKMKFVCSM